MSQSRDRWVLGASAISESAWLFAVLGVMGAALGLDGSPLRWPALVVILGTSLLTARLRPSFVAALAVMGVAVLAPGLTSTIVRWPLIGAAMGVSALLVYVRPLKEMSVEVHFLLRAVFGAGVVYLMVAASVTTDGSGFDLGWMTLAASEFTPSSYRLMALLGVLLGMLMWWRGGSLATKEFPIESLTLSFRLGVIALAIATTIDIVHPADLDTFPMIFIFFASGLGGLSIGHLLPESREAAKARTWPKVIGGAVATVLGAGLVFSILQRDMLGYLSRPALSMLDAVTNGVFWGLVIPISSVWSVFVSAVLGIFDGVFGGLRDSDANTGLNATVAQRATVAEQAEEEGALFNMVLQVIEWVLIALFVLFVLYLLYLFFRQLLARGPKDTVGRREFLREEANLASDATRLLLRLMPNWATGRGDQKGFRIPDGQPGVVNALRLYYALLTAAEDRGYSRHHHQTPSEFQPILEGIFPQRLVGMATGAFIRACYGNYPASDEQIAEIQSSVNGLTTGPATAAGQGAQPDVDLRST